MCQKIVSTNGAISKTWPWWLLLFGGAGAAWANGLRLAGHDALATARGEAFVATADNPAAVYYNPAGLTQLAGTRVRAGLYGIYYEPTFRPPATAPNPGQTYRSETRWAAAPALFCSHTPNSLPLSVGFGLYAPFGGALQWPQDTGFRSVALESALQYATWNPVVALHLRPTLSLGGGLMVNYGRLVLEQGIRSFYQLQPNFYRFEGDGWSVGYNLGLLWRPHTAWSLGVTFRSATPMVFEGHSEFQLQPVIPAVTRRAARMELEFPLTAVGGISWRPTPQWNLEVNADYTDWGSFGTTVIRQAPPPWPIKPNIPVQLEWRPSWMLSFGVTRHLENGWHVSAGYAFNENSVPDAFYTPFAADLDRHFFSVGAGRTGARWHFDVAYQFGYGPPQGVRGSRPSSQPALFTGQTADGTYEFVSHAVLLTVGVEF